MYDEWVCYINNYVWWMGMLYIIINYVWWMGMLYRIIIIMMNGYVIYNNYVWWMGML